MINVIFQANLVEDPTEDAKNTFQNKHVFLRLAAKMGVNDPANPQYKKTLFMQGSLWGKQAETALSNLKKGSKILVFGTIYDVANNESNGKTYLNTSINIERFEFMDAKTNNNTQTVSAAQSTTAVQGGYAAAVNMGAAPQQQMVPPTTNVQAPAWTMAGGTTPMAANFF